MGPTNESQRPNLTARTLQHCSLLQHQISLLHVRPRLPHVLASGDLRERFDGRLLAVGPARGKAGILDHEHGVSAGGERRASVDAEDAACG